MVALIWGQTNKILISLASMSFSFIWKRDKFPESGGRMEGG